MRQIFRTSSSCKTETLYLLDNNSLSTPSTQHLVNYHSTLCFYEFDYVSHLLWVESYNSPFVKGKVIQSCPTLCNPMYYTVHGILQARILEWVAFPSPGDLPNPGIEPGSPTLQNDSLPAEPQGKPKNTEVGSLSILQWIFPTQESNQGLLHCKWILYKLSYQFLSLGY